MRMDVEETESGTVDAVSGGRRLLEQVEEVTGTDGFMELHIPPSSFWDCVDCFGENRVEASFTFHPPHFVARFRKALVPRVHEALANWSTQDARSHDRDRWNQD